MADSRQAAASELQRRDAVQELNRRGFDHVGRAIDYARNTVVEPLVAMGTGALAEIGGGVGSFISAPYVGVDKALEAQRNVQAMAYQPKTVGGQHGAEALGNVVQKGVDVANMVPAGYVG